jgi:hypothetical protein
VERHHFDHLARLSAAVSDRRIIIRTLAAGVLAEIGLSSWATRVEAKNADPAVVVFERLAAEMAQASGDCEAVAKVARRFRKRNLQTLQRLTERERRWDAGTRSRVAIKYQDRITEATGTLHTVLASCRYRGAPETAICRTQKNRDSSPRSPLVPGSAQCTGCDCGCICPISAGQCTLTFFACLGGSEASCCWFGACAGHLCTEQCPNCCNCNVNCCGC